MEPQVIDYYNELPHGLHVIDKMNKELEDQQKKYEKLEKSYNELKDLHNLNIRIQFSSIKDRNEKHKQMMDKIKETCNSFIDGCLLNFIRCLHYNYYTLITTLRFILLIISLLLYFYNY